MTVDDQGMLDLLAPMLAPVNTEPPLEGLVALRNVVAKRRATGMKGSPAWLHRRWLVAAAATAAVFGGSGVAFAAGAPVPTPVRAVASDLGLPVTSPGLYALHEDEGQLQQLVEQAHPDPAATIDAARALKRQFEGLSTSDLHAAGSEPMNLLARANRLTQQMCSAAAENQVKDPGATQKSPNPAPANRCTSAGTPVTSSGASSSTGAISTPSGWSGGDDSVAYRAKPVGSEANQPPGGEPVKPGNAGGAPIDAPPHGPSGAMITRPEAVSGGNGAQSGSSDVSGSNPDNVSAGGTGSNSPGGQDGGAEPHH